MKISFTFLLESPLSDHVVIEIAAFSLLSIHISTFSFATFLAFKLAHCPTPARPPALHCEKQLCLASPNVTAHHMCAYTPALHCEKRSCPASPNVTATQKFPRKTMPRIRKVGAAPAPAPRRTSLAFATPCTQIYYENTGVHTFPYLTFKCAQCPTPATQSATSHHKLRTTCTPAPHLQPNFQRKTMPRIRQVRPAPHPRRARAAHSVSHH